MLENRPDNPATDTGQVIPLRQRCHLSITVDPHKGLLGAPRWQIHEGAVRGHIELPETTQALVNP